MVGRMALHETRNAPNGFSFVSPAPHVMQESAAGSPHASEIARLKIIA
jgi:hypothetical protein